MSFLWIFRFKKGYTFIKNDRYDSKRAELFDIYFKDFF